MANYPKNKCGVYEGNTSYINDCIPQELVIDNVRLAAAYIPLLWSSFFVTRQPNTFYFPYLASNGVL